MFLIVSIANQLDQTFTYKHNSPVEAGSRVVVPLVKATESLSELSFRAAKSQSMILRRSNP